MSLIKYSTFVINEGKCPKYWGDSGAGVLPFCSTTKRFLPNLRSAHVMQPNTYGIFGGGIFVGEEEASKIKDAKELIDSKNEHIFRDAAKRELGEETGYHGAIDLQLLYVYQDNACDWHYYNYLGTVFQEFNSSPTDHRSWEQHEDGSHWVTFDELLSLNPKHFGLKKLLDEAGSKLKTISK